MSADLALRVAQVMELKPKPITDTCNDHRYSCYIVNGYRLWSDGGWWCMYGNVMDDIPDWMPRFKFDGQDVESDELGCLRLIQAAVEEFGRVTIVVQRSKVFAVTINNKTVKGLLRTAVPKAFLEADNEL